MVPSAVKRLSRLGMRKATMKASAAMPAPRTLATSLDWSIPEMREMKVISPTTPAERSMEGRAGRWPGADSVMA